MSPALIRLNTNDTTLGRRRTNDRPSSAGGFSPDDAGTSTSPTSPSHRRFHQKLSINTGHIPIPLRKLTIHRPSTSLQAPHEADEITQGLPTQRERPSVRIAPLDRFRWAVRKVIHMNRMTADMYSEDPGLDARRRSTYNLYGALYSECTIDIVDYGGARAEFKQLSNNNLQSFLADRERPHWGRVRWINVTGLSWDVMSTLSLHYDLHPLAVEDVFGGENLTISKADYYAQHLFLRVLCHIPRDGKEEEETEDCRSDTPQPLSFDPKTSSTHCAPEQANVASSSRPMSMGPIRRGRPGIEREDSRAVKSLASAGLSGAQPWGAAANDWNVSWAKAVFPTMQPAQVASTSRLRLRERLAEMTPEGRARAADLALVEELKKGKRVKVDLRNLYIFYLRDGTVISIHPTAYRTFFDPIMRRLKLSNTMLRSNPDASLLVHALADLVVDYAYDMVEKFRDQTFHFESRVLSDAHTDIIRDVHVASGDLKLLYTTLRPLRNLIRTLRVNDEHKTAALTESSFGIPPLNAQGYMSKQAKVYLADVEDHIVYILQSINQYSEMSEAILDYSFRRLRDETAKSMRTYTLCIVVFFPAIVTAQYFGMNFQVSPSYATSDTLFWKVIPVILFVTVTLFAWHFFESWVHFLRKQLLENRLLRKIRT